MTLELTQKALEKKFARLYPVIGIAALFLAGCFNSQGKSSVELSLSAEPGQLAAPRVASSDMTLAAPAEPQDGATAEVPGEPENSKYTLGPGDVVKVTVWSHPELSGKRVVGPDGEIQIPFVGSFPVTGLTTEAAGSRLTQALQEDYLWTVASITVDAYSGNRIIVLGYVQRPGVLTFPGSPTLLEALGMAGTPSSKGIADALPLKCAIIRGRDHIIWVDMRPLLRGTGGVQNIPLHKNDLVYVPSPDGELVYVMGQVKNPGPYALTANMSFLEALALAGGPSDSAQPGKIVLARPSQHLQQVIDLNDFVKQGQNNYPLQPGDIVYVPKSGVAKVGYVFQQLSPITSMAVFAALL